MRVQGTKPSTWIAAALVMGLLLALSLPGVNRPRTSRRFESSKNSRKIAVAILSYHNAHLQFPPPAGHDKDGLQLLSWRVHVLPFLGEQDLYNEFHLNEPWDSEHNKSLIARMPAVFKNPA